MIRQCAFCTEPAAFEVLVHPCETAGGWTYEETWEDACEDHADPYTYTRVIEDYFGPCFFCDEDSDRTVFVEYDISVAGDNGYATVARRREVPACAVCADQGEASEA